MQLVSASRSRSPNPPASLAGAIPRGDSSSASGLPRVSATIRSTTWSSSRPRIADLSNPRASSSAIPSTTSSGSPRSSASSPLGSRTASSNPRGSASRAPRCERQRLCRSTVEPLRVIDQADQRTLLRDLRQQTQNRQRNQEAVWSAALRQPERHLQRVSLRSREELQATEHGRAQLMNAGERKLHLGLDARRARDATSGGALEHVIEQRGLADAGLAAQDKHGAAPRPDVP
jgi:hypothetical protein